MSGIELCRPSALREPFDPLSTLRRDAKADAAIEYATKIKDWPLLWEAIDFKIKEQRDFVNWWQQTVTPRQSNRRAESQRGTALALAEQETGITQQTVSKWRKRLGQQPGEETAYRVALFEAAYRKAFDDRHYRDEGTGENEWYTPLPYVDAARRVMGSIDVDPASCAEAQEKIRAGVFHTKETDGLNREWHGNVWLNPPYSRDLIARFTQKLTAEFNAERTKQAILLTHNNTDTGWFHDLAAVTSAFCFVRGRIDFYRGENKAIAPNGQVFFYLGSNVDAFVGTFTKIGLVLGRMI